VSANKWSVNGQFDPAGSQPRSASTSGFRRVKIAASELATIESMRHNPGTVVVLAGSAPAQVLAAVDRSMNVTLIRPGEPENGDNLAAAADALQRAARVASPYALVSADPLAGMAAAWQAMWDVSQQPGPEEFEREALTAVTAWRAGRFELPDYYLTLTADPAAGHADFYLGPLRSIRPHRVAFVAAAEPAQQAAGVLHALGSLRHGPWWPPLADVIETARGFYPATL